MIKNDPKQVAPIGVRISIDGKGNFTGVTDNGKNYSVADWNKAQQAAPAGPHHDYSKQNIQGINRTMKPPTYTIVNVIYQIIICWLLVILNAFYNDLLIPESLAHSSVRLGLKILIAVAEGVILIAAAYAGNLVYLSDKDDKVTQKNIANRTGIVQLIITVCFMLVVILKG